MADRTPDNLKPEVYFRVFNEIGIISQLSGSMLQRHLPDGLLVSHFGVVSHLSKGRDGCTPIQIANAFEVPKTTMTHMLSVLENHGLITLKPNPKDGRSKCVWLTGAGQEFVQRAIGKMVPEIADLSGSFSAEDVEVLLPKLIKLREILDASRD